MAKAYRLLVKIKNNRLWSAIIREFPYVKTQSDAAKALQTYDTMLGPLLSMKRWPYSKKRREWSPIAGKIATAVRETEEYLFDAELYGKAPAKSQIAIEIEDQKWIEGYTNLLEPPELPEDVVLKHEMTEALEKRLTALTPREEQILRLLFGLTDDKKDHSLEEVGQIFNVTRERIRQIEAKGLRKMRYYFLKERPDYSLKEID